MSIDRRYLNWGVFLIVLGAIPLAVTLGWISSSALSDAWRFWPFLLIGAGVGLILARTAFAALGGVIVAATFGLMLGGLLAGGMSFTIPACGSSGDLQQVADRSGTFGTTATVALDLDCGKLQVNAVDGSGWQVTASATSDRPAPQIVSTADRLSVRPAETSDAFFSFFKGGAQAWQVDLPRATSIVLGATINAGEATIAPGGGTLTSVGLTLNAGSTLLDVETVRVGRLSATLNAGSLQIVLPASGTIGSITANAGSVKLCAPAGVGLSLTMSGGFASSNDFSEAGLVQQGETWVSPDYASATATVDLHLTGNAASFSLNPREGCR
jgi:LiaF transmembrane domain